MKYFYSQIENLQVVIFYLIHIQDVGERKSYPLEDSLYFYFFFLWIFNSLPAKRDNLRLFSVIDVRAWAARRVLKQNRNMFF